MKYELPDNHGLSDSIISSSLVFKDEDGRPALTDAQYEALLMGVGQGQSVLVVSPTSTGKTQIAIWAIANSLEQGCNTVYLVTHRALAKQKFDDFKSYFLEGFLYGDRSALVVATGDYIENADGEAPAKPLEAPLLVATYEKYLALLSASGIPKDMGSSVFVCDEIQLIGDKSRGQNVELLLTVLRNAGWKQFVGLSAVLEHKDARYLADWLDVSPVIHEAREKHLRYECWSHQGIATVNTNQPASVQENIPHPPSVSLDTLSILDYLLKETPRPVPIIVFCMSKRELYALAENLLNNRSRNSPTQRIIGFDGLPETAAQNFLIKAMARRIAIHSNDLTDEERHVVETELKNGKIDVVFSTPTLAAGVNFPLGAVVFAKWQRWNPDQRKHIPIETAEFHNMAGRSGRMGYDHEQGRVIFIAQGIEIHAAKKYLDLGAMPVLEPQISPQRFNQLALHLVASGLCRSREEIEGVAYKTFSALRELDRNYASYTRWPEALSNAIDELLDQELLIETSTRTLAATAIGKAISYSCLLPETGVFLLKYAISKIDRLVQYLPSTENVGDIARLFYVICSACFFSPEFRSLNKKPTTRALPWAFEKPSLFNADCYLDDLPEPQWRAYLAPINAAKVGLDWINGLEIASLEKRHQDLSAGSLRGMFRELTWILQGFASVINAATDPTNPIGSESKLFQGAEDKIERLRKLPRIIRRLSFRVAEGLPDDVLWMTSLNTAGEPFQLSREEILSLRKLGYSMPEQVMLSSHEASEARIQVFAKVKSSPQGKANWLRDACRNWKQNQRRRIAERHLKRAKNCPNVELIEAYYNRRGAEFEKVFEDILNILNIDFKKLDDNTKTGAPDYLVLLKESPPLIVELKSKEGDRLVDYNSATDVLKAAEIHGHRDTFCVTLCHPGVDPSVPNVIVACGRLSVVESTDLGEALLRICEADLTQKQLWHWLATPGQALANDLPFREYLIG